MRTSRRASSEPNQFSAVIIARAEDLIWGNGVMIDVSGDYKETEKAILQAYADYSEEKNGTYVEPAQNGYVKDLNNLLLQPAKMAMRLLELFMLLSVLISLLGLVAMSTYYSEQSTKSIAVRKVFGSNVHRELWRSVKDYMVLVGIAALIGVPLAVVLWPLFGSFRLSHRALRLDYRCGCHPWYVDGFPLGALADLEGGTDESSGGVEEGVKPNNGIINFCFSISQNQKSCIFAK